eukprot:321387_1
MSDPLVWQCVKNHNSFLRKQGVNPKKGGVSCFSAERGNLMSLNSYKYSGIANSKQIRLSSVPTTVGDKTYQKLILGLKVAKKANKPNKSFSKVVVRSQSAKGASKVIASQTTDMHYRKDLVAAANKKWAAMQQFRQVSAGITKPMTVKLS